MTLQDFITTYTGQAVSYDGVMADQGQCEQLVCLYWEDIYGFKCPPIPAAYELYTNATVLANFDQIPIGSEQSGDVAVWGPSSIINSPEYGHTDIVVNPGFLGFDSNWGNVNNAQGYPVAHEVRHSYQDVLGFLRFKQQEEPMFNEGDAVNFNNYFYGKDNGQFRNFVGQDWKTASYNIQEQLKADNALLTNAGDVGNMTAAGIPSSVANSVLNTDWKNAAYTALLPSIKTPPSTTTLTSGYYKVN